MVHAHPGFEPSHGDPLTRRTFTTFFDVLELLLRAGVTVVAEAAFQDRLWRPKLEPLAELAEIRVVRCTVDSAVAHHRIAQRIAESTVRTAHADRDLLENLESGKYSLDSFVPISLPVPNLRVDTTDGYLPGLDEIVTFINSGQAG